MRNNFLIIFILLFIIFSCKKEDTFKGEQDIDAITKYSNENQFSGKLDSIEFIEFISKQKLQEIYDLMLVQKEKNTDIELNNLIKNQLKSYFLGNDSLYINTIRYTLDSLNVKYISVEDVIILKRDSIEPDSIGFINYNVKYYNHKKKFISNYENSAKFILKKSKNKQFKFYFENIILDKDTLRKKND